MNRDVCGRCDAPTDLCECHEPVPFLRIRREVSALIVSGLAVRKSNQRDRRRVTIWPTARLNKIVSKVWREIT